MSGLKEKRNFVQDLNRVKDAIVATSEHYNIYYIYTNDRDRPKYVKVMNSYLGFFRASISAQFTTTLLTLSKVLDKNTKNNRISMYSLLEYVERHKLIESAKLQKIKNDLNGTDEMFQKLQVLRNNQFAHIGNLDSKKAFKTAGISPNDLKKLINLSIDTLQSIYHAYDRSDFPFDYHSKEDTYSLLNDLLKNK
ncbi:MAG: hypothetical protein RQ760_12870 [Sedimentisphaerales bacterium]|nr:hypothetical protein [Sedimentisphaerales bacterium]